MIVISGNTGSAPLIGSMVNWDRASIESVRSEKESKVHFQIRRLLRPVQGRPDSRWSEKAPSVSRIPQPLLILIVSDLTFASTW